ncbi:MAG: DUF6599 family protein [Candidatus Eisenbacteria bacterium]
MSTFRHRARRWSSAFLLLTAVASPAIGLAEAGVAAAKGATAAGDGLAPQTPAALPAAAAPDGAALLVGLPGWKLDGEASVFAAADLWKHIDGAADQMLAFDCVSLTAAYYRQDSGAAEIGIEVYRMADAPGAFGIYSLERPSDESTLVSLQIGAEGYRTEYEITFFGGPFYVRLRPEPADEGTMQAAQALGEAISEAHLAGSRLPGELAVFPVEDRIAGSLGFLPRAALGLTGLDRAYAARYRTAGGTLMICFAPAPAPAQGAAAFTEVGRAFEKRSVVPVTATAIGAFGGWQGELKYQGIAMLFDTGAGIVAAAGDASEAEMRMCLARCLGNLNPGR